MQGLHNSSRILLVCVSFAATLTVAGKANAGAFGLREQSTYYTGDAYAGSAAGGDISSMYWNPAATAALPGINFSDNATGIFASAKETATGGLLVAEPGAPLFGFTPNSTNVGTDGLVPASYATYQYNDQLYFGLAMNAPFGLITKPDNSPWAGSPIARTTRVFSFDVNPTVAYKITPELTLGAGVQAEYLDIRLNRGSWTLPGAGTLIPPRSFEGNDWGVGGTAGVLWQPLPGTSLGLGYRSAVSENLNGSYLLGLPIAGQGIATNTTASLTLPDEVTFSFRQAVTPQLAILGTVEWDNWSRVGNVNAVSGGCLLTVGSTTCETMHLNYRDGWFFSVGGEYAYTPSLTLRAGVGYEISPVTDFNRDTLLPDSNRVHLNIGASYKWSDKITLLAAYSHIFFDNAPFCIAEPTPSPTTHCVPGNVALLSGSADISADIVSIGVNYKFGAAKPLEMK
jgi:long-chain fatty acid transport protein